MSKLKLFEGVPDKYHDRKAMVVPDALRVVRLRSSQKYSRLGKISRQVGWKYASVIQKLEGIRKTRSAAHYQRKKELQKLRERASKEVDLSEISAILEPSGY